MDWLLLAPRGREPLNFDVRLQRNFRSHHVCPFVLPLVVVVSFISR
jgi:hypothetical protein